jgi:murein L,D-transpeptidase YcbB/YkuD
MCASRPFSLLAGAAVGLVLAGFPPDGMAGQGQELSGGGSGQSTEPPRDVGFQPIEPSIAANLVPTDLAVAQKLQETLAGGSERIFERKEERSAAQAFYASRGYAPLWVTNGIENKHARSVISRLKEADNDGLDPTDYPIPDFKAAVGRPEALAEAELILSKSVLTYARHAQTGRLHYSRISADIAYQLTPTEPREVLANIASAANPVDALESYSPPHEGFRVLRAKLIELRSRQSKPIDLGGATPRLGMRDSRVAELRQRLGVPRTPDNNMYDHTVIEAVKKFQREHGLKPTGEFGPASAEALKMRGSDNRSVETILANMERWRWLPRELGKAYVMVNIPDYSLKVVRDGAIIWQTKIVVGKPTMPTPLLSEQITFITINPTWNVPPSIVRNEYLPALRQDPYALARIGLRIEHNRDGSIHVFQPPGERNALGRIRFNFPNKFLVYQHDTPDKRLFTHEKRAYSHGCMRVENPLDYAEVLLSITRPQDGYTAERLHRMFGRDERDITFTSPIPVHITYQTAFVDQSGSLQTREDIYGRDTATMAILKSEDRKYAYLPAERHDERARSHQALRLPSRSYLSRSAYPRAPEYQSNNWGFGNWGYGYNTNATYPFSWWR